MYFVLSGVIAKKALLANSMQELRDLARTKGATLNFGTLGPGSVPDVFRQWLNREWNVNFADVAYKGGGEVAQALIKGEIDIAYIGMGNMTTQLQDGQLKAFAIEGPHRSKYLPNVPTFAEAGIGNYPMGGPIWWGIHVPVGTPDAIIRKVSDDVGRRLRTPAIVDFWRSNSSSRRQARPNNSRHSPKKIVIAPAKSSAGSTCQSNETTCAAAFERSLASGNRGIIDAAYEGGCFS
jgi:tripartite-type tricarboxylate transporter receptor subunit TctC